MNQLPTSFEFDTGETLDLERQITEEDKRIADLDEKFKQVEDEVNNLRSKNIELIQKLAECERQQKELSSRLFCVNRFITDGDISFYTGVPSYATSMAIFEYLNPGDSCENIRPRGGVTSLKIFIIQTLMRRAMFSLQRKDVAESLWH